MDAEPRTGTYRETPPPAALRRHFRCSWVHRGADRPASLLIVPDGSIDLCLRDGRLTVIGPDRTAVRDDIPAGATTIGLRFRAGAAASWLGVPASVLAGRRVPLEDLWGGQARRIAEAAAEAGGSAASALRVLEAAFAGRAAASAPPDAAMRRVFALLRAPAGAGEPAVARLAGLVGTSERTLRRRCHEAFGYGPKTLERILRFQRFLVLAGAAGLADAAAGAGYADQAHLSREVRRLCGLTPSEVIAEIAA